MLQNILKISGIKEISKAQQNQIMGSGDCCLECVRDSDCNSEQVSEFAKCVYFI